MQKLGIGSGFLLMNWVAGEHGAIRACWGEVGFVTRLFGRHSGIRTGSVSSRWLHQYDAETNKRGEDQ